MYGTPDGLPHSLAADRPRLAVVRADQGDAERHRAKLAAIADKNGQRTLWEELEG